MAEVLNEDEGPILFGLIERSILRHPPLRWVSGRNSTKRTLPINVRLAPLDDDAAREEAVRAELVGRFREAAGGEYEQVWSLVNLAEAKLSLGARNPKRCSGEPWR